MEKVLVIPTECLWDLMPRFEGYRALSTPEHWKLLTHEQLRFMDRAAAEKDSAYKQLIPYVLVTTLAPRNPKWPTDDIEQRVLTYSRAKLGGETRLHHKLSLGIGGHINDTDTVELEPTVDSRIWDNPAASRYYRAMQRELDEELPAFPSWLADTIPAVGCINDDLTEVGSVHFGILHYAQVNGRRLMYGPELYDAQWLTVPELLRYIPCFESWSQITILKCLDPNSGS